MTENIWTGPALSNPRNRRRMTFVVAINEQDAELVAALRAGTFPKNGRDVTIVGRGDATFSGSLEISDFVWNPFERSVRFHLTNRAAPDAGGWRIFYEVSALVDRHTMEVTPIDVAPDDPSVAFPSSPA